MSRIFIVALLLSLGVGGAPAAHVQQGQSSAPDFDALVQRAMTAFQVPGLSLAVVKDGQIVVARGYGVRKIGEPAPVDARAALRAATAIVVLQGRSFVDM